METRLSTHHALPEHLNFFSLKHFVNGIRDLGSDKVFRLPQNFFCKPVGTVALASLVDYFRRDFNAETQVDFRDCDTRGYLERVGFYKALGLPAPLPSGARHSADGRFCELIKVGDDEFTTENTKAVVDMLLPNAEKSQTLSLSHVVSELINNACQHSRAYGWVAGQYFERNDTVEFAIADSGLGLRDSLTPNFNLATDSCAIMKAFEVGVTSNPPHPGQPKKRNRGVGLPTVRGLVKEAGGTLRVWTGKGAKVNGRFVELESHWKGTLVEVTMKRKAIPTSLRKVMSEIETSLTNNC